MKKHLINNGGTQWAEGSDPPFLESPLSKNQPFRGHRNLNCVAPQAPKFILTPKNINRPIIRKIPLKCYTKLHSGDRVSAFVARTPGDKNFSGPLLRGQVPLEAKNVSLPPPSKKFFGANSPLEVRVLFIHS